MHVVTLADGLPAVTAEALQSLRWMQRALPKIRGGTEPRQGLADETDRLIAGLELISQVSCLQTPEISQKVVEVMQCSAKVFSSVGVMAADCLRGNPPKEVMKGGPEYRHLEVRLGQFGEVRRELGDLVARVYVGLRGDVRLGYVVDRTVLLGVAEQVRSVFEVEMVLLEKLRAKVEGGSGELILFLRRLTYILCVFLPRSSSALLRYTLFK
jgi:hypothetical protein